MNNTLKTKIKQLDEIAEKKYNILKESFFGKISIKLFGEVILAFLIAGAVYLGTTIYNDLSVISVDNQKIDQIYISISDEYIQEQFGTPYICFNDSEELTNRFYLLEDAILRTVSKENRVVAYFITITNETRRIPVDSFGIGKNILGKITYSETMFSEPKIYANITANGRYCYYVEVQGTGRYGMFNYYLYGNAPYGIVNSDVASLISNVADQLGEDVELDILRQKTKPDTFGVIADGYEGMIGILTFCDEWENMYYLLNFKR